MTSSEALEVFGSEIPFRYYSSTTNDYVESTFLYSSVSDFRSVRNYTSDYLDSSPDFLVYTAQVSDLRADPNYITVDVQPSYSIFNTQQIHSCIALSTNHSYSSSGGISATAYQSPQWEWVFGGQRQVFENAETNSGRFVMLTVSDVPFQMTFVPADFESQSSTSGYSLRAVFNGNTTGSTNILYLAIGVPYVSEDANGANGTDMGSGSGSGSSGGTDMTETNGILGRIWSAIVSIPDFIIDGIAAIFIPEEDYLENEFQTLREHFAWYEQIQEAGEIFRTAFAANQFSDEPVVIIGQARSNWTGGSYFSDGSLVLDMNVFAPYRDSVRAILRAFIWIFFFWRLFARLPDILQGAGMGLADWFHIGNELEAREFNADMAQLELDANVIYQNSLPELERNHDPFMNYDNRIDLRNGSEDDRFHDSDYWLF